MPTEAQVLAIDRVEDRSTKRCTNCGKPKPIGEFARNPTKRDGRSSWCLWCTRIYRYQHYHEGGGKEYVTAYHARPEVKARIREYRRARKEQLKASKLAYNRSPRGRIAKCRSWARGELRKAVSDGRRARLEELVAAYDREIARLDARKAAEREAELPADPIPPAGDCDFRGVHRTAHGTFSVLVTVPGKDQVRGGSHATIEAARAEANRLGREHLGIDGYAVPKWRRRA